MLYFIIKFKIKWLPASCLIKVFLTQIQCLSCVSFIFLLRHPVLRQLMFKTCSFSHSSVLIHTDNLNFYHPTCLSYPIVGTTLMKCTTLLRVDFLLITWWLPQTTKATEIWKGVISPFQGTLGNKIAWRTLFRELTLQVPMRDFI